MNATNQIKAFDREIEAARLAEAAGKLEQAWRCLELAHIVGQGRMALHWRCHRAMLELARRTGNRREVTAQLLRLALTPAGNLTDRLPQFNPGSGRVGPFEQADWPAELDPVTLERRNPAPHVPRLAMRRIQLGT